MLEEPAADIRGALLHAPELRLRRFYFAHRGVEGAARLSRYARRGGRGGVQPGEGLRRIADLDLCSEFLLESADAGRQNCVFLREKRSGEGPGVCVASHSGERVV